MMRRQQLRRQTFLVDQPFMPERIATRLIEGGLVSSPIKMPCSIAFERGGLAQGFDIGSAQMLIPANNLNNCFLET